MEVGGVFFDVRLQGQKILVDEGRNFIVGIGLGLQPSASASSRGGAEINKQRLFRRFSLCERRIGILFPFDCHVLVLLRDSLECND
jgi:hypothetical protein